MERHCIESFYWTQERREGGRKGGYEKVSSVAGRFREVVSVRQKEKVMSVIENININIRKIKGVSGYGKRDKEKGDGRDRERHNV